MLNVCAACPDMQPTQAKVRVRATVCPPNPPMVGLFLPIPRWKEFRWKKPESAGVWIGQQLRDQSTHVKA